MPFDTYPFHASQWPAAIARPDAYDGGEVLGLSWDLGSVAESEKKKLIAQWVAKLPTLTHVKRLQLWSHVTQPLFDAACAIRGLEVLQIKWSNIQHLDAIAGLANLRALSVGSSTRIISIVPLSSLTSLEILEIENFKLIDDFSPFMQLTGLESLAVTGSMWSRQDVGSLEPFAAMTWLKSLAVDTSKITSLKPLARLRGLKHLSIGGRLPYQEYAWLSAQLPHTECRWFTPFYALQNSGHSACKTCKQDALVMVTGRGKPTLCSHCDAAKLDLHVRLFNDARAAAMAGAS